MENVNKDDKMTINYKNNELTFIGLKEALKEYNEQNINTIMSNIIFILEKQSINENISTEDYFKLWTSQYELLNQDYGFSTKDNNINNFIEKLIILTNIYYEINECNYDCNLINLIFNGNTYDVFNNNTESFEEDDMVFKFINIKNLYGYLNRDDNMLDYSVVNFNKTEDLRTYYNNNKNNLEEMYNNFDFN